MSYNTSYTKTSPTGLVCDTDGGGVSAGEPAAAAGEGRGAGPGLRQPSRCHISKDFGIRG